ncbi:MAG: CPBP family intramembrane metalloprotease [Myxococcales bacterium]|nr:CPBP family intramembrane metalloprotease [Myxococcales bacterium]
MTRRARRSAASAHPAARSAPPSFGHGELAASLVLIFPLLLAYEIGVLFAGHVNGADVVTRALYGAVGSRGVYLLIHALFAVGFLLWVRRGQRWTTLTLEIATPVILEAAIYALTLAAVGSLIVERLLGLGLTGDSVISALGAGVHEELVFRLGAMAGLVALLARTQLDRRISVAFALLASAAVFAAAHHLGSHGEVFTTHAFAYRCVAGVVFGLVFWFRSLAHAVYAHVLYDLVIAAS